MTHRMVGLRGACIAVVAACLASACDSNDMPTYPGAWNVSGQWTGQVVITQDPDDSKWPDDAVTISSATIDGDTLSIDVSFGGGCRDHSFALLAETAWMESYPVQVRVRLAHDGNGDMCRALLTRVVRFDLSPLKAAYAASYQTTTGMIQLRLDDAPSMPTYGF